MNHDNLLIRNENEKFAICLITDDHKSHIIGHLKYAWKPRIARHIFDHIYLAVKARKVGIPNISLEEVLSSVRGLKNEINKM